MNSGKGLLPCGVLGGVLGVFVVAGALFAAHPAQAALEVRVDDGNVQPLPIAIPDFLGVSPEAASMGAAVTPEMPWLLSTGTLMVTSVRSVRMRLSRGALSATMPQNGSE